MQTISNSPIKFNNNFCLLNQNNIINNESRKRERNITTKIAKPKIRVKKTDLDFKKSARKVKNI